MDAHERRTLPEGWELKRLGDVITFEYGKGLREDIRDQNGNIPVYGSNGIVGYHSVPLIEKPCIIVGRKGSAGQVHMSKVPSWPIDTTYFITPPENIDLYFLFYLLSTLKLVTLDKSTAIPGLNRNDAYALKIPLPRLPTQRRIVSILENMEFILWL
jgi:type I restriction enzyme S subunit